MNRHQHPTNNAVLGAPPGVSHDQCFALPITRVNYTDGGHGVASYWMPTAEEFKLIGEGRPIRVLLQGQTHAPLHVGVDGDGVLP